MLLLCASPQVALAGACCVGANAVGVGRLLLWEAGAIGLSSTVAGRLGHWTPDGTWQPNDDGFGSIEWRNTLWGLARIVEPLTVSLEVPAVMTHTRAGELDSLGGGLGDLQLGLRYEPLRPGERRGLPGFAVSLRVQAPTGRSVEGSDDPLAADVTSRGGWVLSTALAIEWVRIPWFVRGDLGLSVPMPHDVRGREQRFGVGVIGLFAAGAEVTDGLVISGLLSASWEDRLSIDSRPIDGSAVLQLALGASVSWRFADSLTVLASLRTGIFADGLGDNGDGTVSGTLGLRYGILE